MSSFKSIEEILSGNFELTYNSKPKTDRVLKSTKIEQAIYEDVFSEMEELSEYSEKGTKKLKTFDSLINDVFQSVYGLRARYNEESDMSDLSKTFNKGILSELVKDSNYSAVKSVCEGKELPSIGATEEFTQKLLENLDTLMRKSTDGRGDVDGLDRMEEDKEALYEKLSELLQKRQVSSGEQKSEIEKKIVNTANKITAKNEQLSMYSNIIKKNMKQNGNCIKQVIGDCLKAAKEKADDVSSCMLAWGDGNAEMQKNPVNLEVLKRVSKSSKLRYIAKFLGRFKELLSSQRLAGFKYGRGEKYDIEYGNNISRALTSEIAMLSSKELMPLFIKKYQGKALKQYRKREPEYKGKGDIIVCLDESGSTFGENNAYGMAVAMVLYEICKVNKSNFALIHFASYIKTDYFPKDENASSEKVLDCAETFLNGGTNFEKPIKEAMNLVTEGKLSNPDIVFITDGVCSLSEDVLTEFKSFKDETKVKLTGILLDKGEHIDFSLKKFADCIYRTSELLEEKIVENLIEERI